MNPLADRILSAHARSRPSVGDPRAALRHEDFLAAVEDVGRAVRVGSPTSRPMVVAALPLSVDALAVLAAAVVGEFSLCFVDPSAPEDRRRAVLEAVSADVVVDSAGVHATTTAGRETPETAETASGPAGYVAMSSGSTGGGPKGVLSPWTAVDAFVGAGAEALDLDHEAVWAEVTHPSYDLAMTNLLVALAAGCSLQVGSALGDRLRPLRYADLAGATHLRLAPRFVDLAAAEGRPAPSSLRVWGSGGDRLAAAGARRILALGVGTVVNTYGTSETVGFACAARLTDPEAVPESHGVATIGQGPVGPWRTDVDPTGMLTISSPHLPRGYLFGTPTGGFPRWEGDRVLTGDLGERVDGHLFCLGRADRRVKRSGSFVDLDELDAQVSGRFGTAVLTVATSAGDLVSLVEADPDDLTDLGHRLPRLLRPDTVPDRLVPVVRLPRLGNGKVDHAAALAIAEVGGRPAEITGDPERTQTESR